MIIIFQLFFLYKSDFCKKENRQELSELNTFKTRKTTISATLLIRKDFKFTILNRVLSFLHEESLKTTLTVPLISLICEVLNPGIDEVDDVCDEEECVEEEEEECGLCHSIYMRECDIKMEYKYTPVKETKPNNEKIILIKNFKQSFKANHNLIN